MNWTYFLSHPLKLSALLHCKAAFLCDASNTAYSEAANGWLSFETGWFIDNCACKIKMAPGIFWHFNMKEEATYVRLLVKLTQGCKFMRDRSLIAIWSSENNQYQNVTAVTNSAAFPNRLNKQIIESQQKKLKPPHGPQAYALHLANCQYDIAILNNILTNCRECSSPT